MFAYNCTRTEVTGFSHFSYCMVALQDCLLTCCLTYPQKQAVVVNVSMLKSGNKECRRQILLQGKMHKNLLRETRGYMIVRSEALCCTQVTLS